MAIQLNHDIAAREQAGWDWPDDQHDDHDLFIWVMKNSDRPFAELEARMDEALRCTKFAGQMAAMEEHVNIDAAKQPPALPAKWDRPLTRIAETTVMGVCPPLEWID